MFGRKRQRVRMPTLDPKPEVGRWVRRLAGLTILVLGVGALADSVRSLLFGDSTWRQAVGHGFFVLPLCLVAVFFGYRLLLNRPNAYGSIMGPTAWRIGALLILIGTGFVAVLQLQDGMGVSWRLLGLLAFAGACVGKAEHMVRRGEITFDRSARPFD
jgi:hypothetical protein